MSKEQDIPIGGKSVSFEEHQKLLESYADLKQDYDLLKFELAQFKRMIFGQKSERFVPAGDSKQLSLFEDQAPAEESQDTQTEQITYQRKKKTQRKEKPVRAPLPAHLLRVEEVVEPENLPEGARKIGEEITEVLACNPAKVFVRRIVRIKYALPQDKGVTIASLPQDLPLPKSNADASLLAFILVSKYIDHLPFYRQIQIFRRLGGLKLSDSTLNGWFNAATDLLEPLYQILVEEVLRQDYLQADESRIPVQSSHKKGSLHQGYMWVYHAPVQNLVLFKYDPTRKHEVPKIFLKDFDGTLQTDGYEAYPKIDTTLHLACWAHARRHFEKALTNDPQRAEKMLTLIGKLYTVERKARERNVDDATKQRYRNICARPVLGQIHTWLKENLVQTLPKSPIGKAITYSLNLWEELTGYIDHPRYQIDNNLVENAIRPLALGRKNYLFAGSHEAAQKAAMMYSFFATCKVNNVNPYDWLVDVLQRINQHKVNKLSELLPQNWKPANKTNNTSNK